MEFIEANHASTDDSEPDESSALFEPDFQCPDGHVLIAVDSLAENPFLAITLLKGVALSQGMENLPEGKANSMASGGDLSPPPPCRFFGSSGVLCNILRTFYL